MTNEKDGGPVFPQQRRRWVDYANADALRAAGRKPTGALIDVVEPGMSLRDYFAANSLQSILHSNGSMSVSEDVKLAYRYADAMLAARKEK